MTSQNLLVLALLLVALAGGLVIRGVALSLRGGDQIDERISIYAAIPDDRPRRGAGRRRTGLVRLRLRFNSLLSAFTSESLSLQLMSADWPVTGLEFVALRLGITLAGLILGWLVFGSPLSAAGLALLLYLAPGLLLQRAIQQRRLQFSRQLVDVLVLLNGAVRAGFSLLQATEVVVKELKPPASDEFRRVQREVGLGLSLSQALENLSSRMQNPDFDLVVTAIKIHAQVGGNLATMLTAVTETIRDRLRLFGEVRVLTTQQRYTSYILSLLPFFVGGAMFLLNPEYMEGLFNREYICIPLSAVGGVFLGSLVIRRMAKIEV